MDLNIGALLTPIPGDNSAGQDMHMSSSNELDILKEARRSDDPAFAQGEWQKEIKKADWSKVEKIALDVITTKSKDLQFVGWLLEALAQKYHFDGLNQGLQFIRRLLEAFWDNLYPVIEDNDLGPRVAKLEWINNNLPSVIYSLPLCSGETGKYSWQDIQQARELDNLGRKDPEAMQKAIAEGKLTQADIDRALNETSDEFILKNYELLTQCRQSFTDLDETIPKLYVIKASSPDLRETSVAPSLRDLSDAIGIVYDFVAQTARSRQLIDVSHPTEHEASMDSSANTVSNKNTLPEKRQMYASGSIQTREDALKVLAEVSLYFKKSEPHSPIYYLLDRAVKWGNMPLDQWLQEMIKEGWSDLPTLLKLIGKQESS